MLVPEEKQPVFYTVRDNRQMGKWIKHPICQDGRVRRKFGFPRRNDQLGGPKMQTVSPGTPSCWVRTLKGGHAPGTCHSSDSNGDYKVTPSSLLSCPPHLKPNHNSLRHHIPESQGSGHVSGARTLTGGVGGSRVQEVMLEDPCCLCGSLILFVWIHTIP